MNSTNKQKGDFGERLAADYLTDKGYSIACKNYRCPFGEIDIISEKEGCICFVEVKYRKSFKFGMPREAVTKAKEGKIKKTAEHYVFENDITDTNMRFDVIEITDKVNLQIVHIQNAF